MQVRVLTLNIWGVRYISKFIDERLHALVEYLLNPNVDYDIIGLQEVWSKKDFVYLRDRLKAKYPHSYYFLSGLIGSGCCMITKYPIISVYEHRYTLNGFPHKIQHGDWFCGKLIGLCKILIHGYLINVYNTHLHANYHHIVPKDIYLGHRVCQSYELIQFIESTSSAETTDLTILLGDLNLREIDLGFQLIQRLLKLNDSFLQRINKDIYDPSVGNSGRTCDLLDNPYVHPHAHQGEGDRIDYILYRSRNDNVQCLECYPTLHKVPNNFTNLHYSDHLAVYALFEFDEKIPLKQISFQDKSYESFDKETHENLRSACIIVEQSIQRIQRHRYYSLLIVFLLFFILFSFNRNLFSNHFFFLILIFFKNLFCLIGLALSLWFIYLGKPFERNALQSIRNAMHLRLRTLEFAY